MKIVLFWAFCFVFFCISDKIIEFLIYIPHLRTLPNKSCAFFSVCFFNDPDSSVLAAMLQKFSACSFDF